MKASKKLLAVILALVVSAFAVGCGGGGSPENRELVLGDIGWDENVAVSNLTKALLEDELGYGNVELQQLDVALLFEGVGNGDLDAFQDVWLPNHQQFVDEQGNDVVLLDPWYQGQTEFGIAVPDYVNITSIPELNQTDITEILGIEPGAVISEQVPNEVIPTYDLEQEYIPSSTAGMLSEVDNLYDNQEPFAFTAWSPHWMNQRYDFHFLQDPEDALGELNDPAEMMMIVNEDLPDDDPVAMAFMQALTLNEEQLNDLEDTINEAGDPLEGARQWAQDNPEVVQPWIEAARSAQES
jgi:glycine betaine/proline transport system substrate-binding protein